MQPMMVAMWDAAAQQLKRRPSFSANNLIIPSAMVNPNATLHFALGFDPGAFAATPGTHSDEHMGINAPLAANGMSLSSVSTDNKRVPSPLAHALPF
jgi:hypothetical protein